MSGRHQSTPTLQQRPACPLHLCNDLSAFRAAFQVELGRDIDGWLAELAHPDCVAAVILGGVIPLGIGSATSDIDLIVVVDDPAAIKSRRLLDGSASGVHGGVLGESDKLMVAETFTVVNGRDVYVQFVILGELSRLSAQLASADAWRSLSGHSTQILSRIKTGWMLTVTNRLRRACAELLQGRSLEVHCAVRCFAAGLRDFEKAKWELSDDVTVALHLGRSTVQGVLTAYLAGNGLCYIGNEWLKMLSRAAKRSGSAAGAMSTSLIERGIELLFPPLTNVRDEAFDYLNRVAEFVGDCKRHMEDDTAFRAAFNRRLT